MYWIDILKRNSCSSLWEVLPITEESSESLFIGFTWTMNIWFKEEGVFWKKMMMWSVERRSCGNSEKDTESDSCCTTVPAPSAPRNFSGAKPVKEMTMPVVFLYCFLGISNVSSRE